MICASCADGFYRGIESYCLKCHPFFDIPVLGLAYFLLLALATVAFWLPTCKTLHPVI